MSVLGRLLATLVTKVTALVDRYSTSYGYRAERHYMRGPGPACERKKSGSA
jgi:hypothetical protein